MTSPTFFGRYQLLDKIARGGMAEVFLARTVSVSGFEKELVIKRILPEYSGDPIFEKMFVDEARIAAKLYHPNIVQVFDFDLVEGSYYIAMEYIEGRDLSTIMDTAVQRKEPISVTECIYVIREVAKALDYAHRRQDKGEPLNIIHRDISPHNVLISYEGAVKLTDFGIAKAASRLSRTKEGIVKGKLAYMSPEQAKGIKIDCRSDLFSLGTIFYELVTLRKLFWGNSDREILLKVMNANVSSPRSAVRDLPFEVESIIMKLLSRKAETRYQDAAGLLSDLGRVSAQFASLSSADLAWRQRMESFFPKRIRREPKSAPGSWPPSPQQPVEQHGPGGTPVLKRAVEVRTPPPRPTHTPPPGVQSDWDLEEDTQPTVQPALSVPPPIPPEARRVALRSAVDRVPTESAPLPKFSAKQDKTVPTMGHVRRQRVVTPEKKRFVGDLFKRKTVRYRFSFFDIEDPLRAKRRKTRFLVVSIGVGMLLTIAFLLILFDPLRVWENGESLPGEVESPEERTIELFGVDGLAVDGTLILRSVPEGAQVYMNGAILPERTPMSISLPLHEPTQFRLTLEPYPARNVTITLTGSDQPVEYLIDMVEPSLP